MKKYILHPKTKWKSNDIGGGAHSSYNQILYLLGG